MDSSVIDLLRHLGMSELEAGVYAANLELGPATASAIAAHAGTKRVTAYEALKRLTARGFVRISVKKRKATHFEPVELEKLRDELQRRKRSVEDSLRGLDMLKPFFAGERSGGIGKTEISYYEGAEGVRTVMMDTLRHGKDEILSFTSSDGLQGGLGKEFLDQYYALRTKKRIITRGIMADTPAAVQYYTPERNSRELRRVKFVPRDKYVFRNDISIYGDRVGIMSLQKGGQQGIIIRSRSLADSVRAMFELQWATLP